MIVKDTIALELADHAELGKLLLQKIQKEGITIRDSVIFPVSAGSVLALSSLLECDEMDEINDIIWMPGDNKPPISPSTKCILLVDAIVGKTSTSLIQAKKVLEFLLKRFKLEKKLKDIKFYAPCWLTDAGSRDIGGGIRLLPAVFAPEAGKIKPLASKNTVAEGARRLSLADAMKEMKWDPDHVFMEKHELVLQKLKTDLWE